MESYMKKFQNNEIKYPPKDRKQNPYKDINAWVSESKAKTVFEAARTVMKKDSETA
tara:strand:- start:374 stop:541 length:168 start_codon:yes stop_codon:yes gene_type:complete